MIDSVTSFDDPLQRIRTGQIARVPILLGSREDDGTLSLPIIRLRVFLHFYVDLFGSLCRLRTPR